MKGSSASALLRVHTGSIIFFFLRSAISKKEKARAPRIVRVCRLPSTPAEFRLQSRTGTVHDASHRLSRGRRKMKKKERVKKYVINFKKRITIPREKRKN